MSENTYVDYPWYRVEKLRALKAVKLGWPNDNFGDDIWIGTVNGTHFRNQEIAHPDIPKDPSIFSFKHHSAGFNYEIVVALRESKIDWFSGPHEAGDWNDIKLFANKGLKAKLKRLGKRVIADKGFDNDKTYFVSDIPITQDDSSCANPSDSFANPNLTLASNKYKAVDINNWVESNCRHLNASKHQALADVLIKYPSLWDNKLGTYPDSKVHLELSNNAIPHSSRGYPVPFAHNKLFKEELDRLVSIGVLEPCGHNEWCAGTFIVGKASGGCHWVTDFHGLNKHLKRWAYPIPKIQDMLQGIQGYEWLSKLNASMQFYTFKLDEESKEISTFATPLGLFRYKHCPMGVTVAPDLAQEAMDFLTLNLENVMTYFDDSLIYNWDWSKHLETLDIVLFRLASKGFSLNTDKCQFGIKETDFLGFWLTPTDPQLLSSDPFYLTIVSKSNIVDNKY